MGYSDGLSASDVALLSGNNGNNGSNSGWGDGNAWWIIVFLIFAFLGFGNRGFGNNGNDGGSNGGGVMDAYVLNSDFATLQRQLDQGFSMLNNAVTTVNEGLCNGFYQELVNANTINSNIASSTAALQSTLCQGFNGVNSAIMNGNFGLQNAINGVSTQLASCCCTLERGQDQTNYNLAMNSNAIQNALCNSTRDIVDSQNAGTRAILDAITANRIEDKNQQIQAQQNEINALRLAASQEKQNAYLLNELKPCPIPAFLTCNPYTGSYGYTNVGYNNGCGCNSGCGCGNY